MAWAPAEHNQEQEQDNIKEQFQVSRCQMHQQPPCHLYLPFEYILTWTFIILGMLKLLQPSWTRRPVYKAGKLGGKQKINFRLKSLSLQSTKQVVSKF